MIRSGRHPHEVVLLLVCVLVGAVGTFGFDQAASTTIRSLPEPWGRFFYLGVLAGSVVALSGAYWRGLAGPLIERSGLITLAGMWASYTVAVLMNSGLRNGWGFSLIVGGFAVANVWRYVQISGELRRIRAAATLTGATGQLGGEPR